jgi:hypothetical protein
VLSLSVQACKIRVNEVDLTKQLDHKYYKLAEAIVEPGIIDDEYFNFADQDPIQWGNWVVSVLGEEYRPIINYINDFGY